MRKFRREGKPFGKTVLPDLNAAAHYAAHKSIEQVKQRTRNKIKSVGLGRLSRAVGTSSSTKVRRTKQGESAFGVIFARGNESSRANQALLAYTEGARILPTGGRKWLAYPTKAAGRLIRKQLPSTGRGRRFGNFRNRPRITGLKTRFVPINNKRAMIVLDDALVNGKTGRAKPFGKRTPKGSVRKKYVVLFWLIRFTTRAARFSQHDITKAGSERIPFYAAQYLNKVQGP